MYAEKMKHNEKVGMKSWARFFLCNYVIRSLIVMNKEISK